MNRNKQTDHAVGRTKMVITSPEGGVVTTVIARVLNQNTPNRLTFSGQVAFEEKVKTHLYEDVLPIVTEIMVILDIPPTSFDISVVNVGATSSSDLGFDITGFSADVPVFMAMLSAGLDMPVRQDIVFTGHIASPDGDIAQVESLPEKAEAALQDTSITSFVYPSLDKDISLQVIKPIKYESVVAAIRGCRGRIHLIEVRTIADLLEKTLEPAAIVTASLKNGFFDERITNREGNNLRWTAMYLANINHKRFWDVLYEALCEKNTDSAHNLIQEFAEYHIIRKRYPSKCGENLNRLVLSLPSAIKRATGFFPLLTKELYIKLIQHATKQDHGDISYLHNALYNETQSPQIKQNVPQKKPVPDKISKIVDYIQEQLNPETIEREVARVYENARVSFALDSITVDSHDEFTDTLTAFFAHVDRHVNPHSGSVDFGRIRTEALALFNKVFPGTVKNNAALAEARHGTRGGLRYIFDTITDYLKQEAREKHRARIVKETVDPLDYDTRKALIQEIVYRGKDILPPEITSRPPEHYADDFESIVIAYAQSMSNVTEILRRL